MSSQAQRTGRAQSAGSNADEDIKRGRLYGPFDSHEEFITLLHKEAKKGKDRPEANWMYTEWQSRAKMEMPGLMRSRFSKQEALLTGTALFALVWVVLRAAVQAIGIDEAVTFASALAKTDPAMLV
jgi:hypothetical protein